MAIEPTGAIYKALEYDGVSSRTYGVYITGEAVYNAPERDVEMIPIPGRNGAFALDNGRFENIEVTYRAGIYADTESDFAQAVSEFRNYLCSKRGYCRLSDEYNPSEYRMAVYKSGLEVNSKPRRAGEFDITFECKPQRFLISGETAVPVASAGTITNPTLFESSPLIEFNGSGDIVVNGTSTSISNQPIGNLSLAVAKTASADTVESVLDTGNASLMDPGDTVTVASGCKAVAILTMPSSVTNITPSISGTLPGGAVAAELTSLTSLKLTVSATASTFAYGTSSHYESTVSIAITYVDGTTKTATCSFKVRCEYDGTNDKMILSITDMTASSPFSFSSSASVTLQSISGNSTRLTITDTIYIDFEIGEAYIINNGNIGSMNNIVAIAPKMPILNPGSNTITYDNTITNFKITPRWWKV